MAFSFINLRPREQDQGFSALREAINDLGSKYVKQQQNQRLYQDVFGLDEQQARALSSYDLPEAIKLFESLGQREGGMEALGGLGDQQQMMQQQMQQPQQPQYREVPTQDSVNQMANLLRQPHAFVKEQLKQIRPEMVQQLVEQENQRAQPGTSYPLTVAQALAKPTKKEMREMQTLDLKERKFAAEEEERKEKGGLEAYKFVQPYLDKLNTAADRASELLRVNERLKELETEGGGLSSQAWNEYLTRTGLDTEGLRNPNDEELLKLQQVYVKGAKDLYGSRITDFDLAQFLKGIPQLSSTPEGRKRLIAQFDQQNRIEQKKRDIAYELIEKNKGKPPKNLAYLVDKKMAPEIEKSVKQFKEDLKRSVPAPSSKAAILAAQGAAGLTNLGSKLLSSAANAAGPAAAGAIAGSLVPGLGTATGGALGGLYGVLQGLRQ